MRRSFAMAPVRTPRLRLTTAGLRRLLAVCWLLTLLGMSCGADPRGDDPSSTATRHVETETNSNKRKSPGLLRVLEKDNTTTSSGGEEDKAEFNITLVFPTSAPVTMFDASAVKEQLFINNFISRSAVSTCQLNLYAADADSDGSLDRDEYAEFVRLESHGRIDESFVSLSALYVALYFAVACNQCYDETQNDDCCLGDKGVIVLPQPGDGQDVGQWVLFLCSTVDEAVDDEFGGLPTTSPTAPPAGGVEPTPTPAAGRPTAPEKQPTRAPNRRRPTGSPTPEPTRRTRAPGARPSDNPTDKPTPEPSRAPRAQPTRRPAAPPTPRPTRKSSAPTSAPVPATTDPPSREPTDAPVRVAPTRAPVTRAPTGGPTPSPVATGTTAPTVAPSIRTSAPVSFPANNTLCVQFFYSLKNTAGLSADDIMDQVNNTLKTGLERATRNITIAILNASFPSEAAAASSRSLSSAAGRCGDAGSSPPPPNSSGGRCRGLADASAAVRGQHVIYGGLADEFGDEGADRILESLLTALYGPKDDVPSLAGPSTLPFGDCRNRRRLTSTQRYQALSEPSTRRQRQQPSRRLVYYTDVLPPNVTDVVDDSFCAGLGGGGGDTNSTSGVKCAFVSTEVCVVLEEGDDPDALEKAIDEGFRIAILDGAFFDAIPPENVP